MSIPADTITKAIITTAEPQVSSRISIVLRFFHRQTRLRRRIHLWRAAVDAQVVRDGARLNLRHVDRPVIDAAVRDREELLSASLTVASADEIEVVCRISNGRRDVLPDAKLQPWGAREFMVKDTDGNLLLFAGPADSASLDQQPSRAPSSANNPDTGSRRHPSASAGGRLRRSTSTGRTGCRKIPRRNRNRRGVAKPAFLTDLSFEAAFRPAFNSGFILGRAMMPCKSQACSREAYAQSVRGSPDGPRFASRSGRAQSLRIWCARRRVG